MNTLGGYECACNRGFRREVENGVMVRCVDVDECKEKPDGEHQYFPKIMDAQWSFLQNSQVKCLLIETISG